MHCIFVTIQRVFLVRRQGVPKKGTNRMHWSHGAQSQSPVIGKTWAWKVFFGRFLLRLSRIKRPQVMSMVKFGPTTLNFGYDFVLLVHLFCVLQFIYFAARIG